jgi:hypothetical protein
MIDTLLELLIKALRSKKPHAEASIASVFSEAAAIFSFRTSFQ